MSIKKNLIYITNKKKMTDEPTIRRVMHQKIKHELVRQTKLAKFFRIVNWTLIGLMLATFVTILIVLENERITVGERALQLLQEKGVVENER
jgi:hypothetical protein